MAQQDIELAHIRRHEGRLQQMLRVVRLGLVEQTVELFDITGDIVPRFLVLFDLFGNGPDKRCRFSAEKRAGEDGTVALDIAAPIGLGDISFDNPGQVDRGRIQVLDNETC